MKHLSLTGIFQFIIIYYWLLVYLQKPDFDSLSALYLPIVLPVAIFILSSLFFIKDTKIPKEILWILLFIVSVASIAIARSDLRAVGSVILLGLTIFVIFHFKLTVNLKLINRLFLFSVLMSIPLYYSGYSIYGFYPGQSHTHHLEVLSGRVSLFPNVTYSMYLSFLVFLFNLFYNHTKSRLLFLSLSLYFIVFGISRTLLLLLIFVLTMYFLQKRFPVKINWLYVFSIPFLLIVLPFILVANIETFISFLIHIDVPFINHYLLRDLNEISEILSDTMRVNAWREHIRIFTDHPLGISQSQVSHYINQDVLPQSDTVAFLTRIFVIYGYGAIFFILFVFSLLHTALNTRNNTLYILIFVFFFLSLLYGPFFNAYNIFFLLYLTLFNYARNETSFTKTFKAYKT